MESINCFCLTARFFDSKSNLLATCIDCPNPINAVGILLQSKYPNKLIYVKRQFESKKIFEKCSTKQFDLNAHKSNWRIV